MQSLWGEDGGELDLKFLYFFFLSSRRRHTGSYGDWSSDVCSSDFLVFLFFFYFFSCFVFGFFFFFIRFSFWFGGFDRKGVV